ncbi:MAG: hypothetical protein KC684_08280, partial [Candidatus Omnitrophica bacterium]|nr:hypothetical protein [Candidatus Omnitrophota bacterium]
VLALGGGILLVLITSVWAFDYPLFMMFYRLSVKISGQAMPALCVYICGLWFPVFLFWLVIVMSQSAEHLKAFIIRFLSTFKILMAALYLSGGISILYLLIIKQ